MVRKEVSTSRQSTEREALFVWSLPQMVFWERKSAHQGSPLKEKPLPLDRDRPPESEAVFVWSLHGWFSEKGSQHIKAVHWKRGLYLWTGTGHQKVLFCLFVNFCCLRFWSLRTKVAKHCEGKRKFPSWRSWQLFSLRRARKKCFIQCPISWTWNLVNFWFQKPPLQSLPLETLQGEWTLKKRLASCSNWCHWCPLRLGLFGMNCRLLLIHQI